MFRVKFQVARNVPVKLFNEHFYDDRQQGKRREIHHNNGGCEDKLWNSLNQSHNNSN